MSTKTSIKRIAAVAAVALTLGGFSAVSAHAAGLASDALSLVSPSSTATIGTATTTDVTLNGYCVAAGDQGVYAVYNNSVPSVGSGVITLGLTAGTATNATIAATGNNGDAVIITCSAAGFYSATATASASVPAAGTYTFKVAGVWQAAAAQTWTVTAAAPTLNHSTAFISSTLAGNGPTADDTTAISAPATYVQGASAVARLTVRQYQSADSTTTLNSAFTSAVVVAITGAGTVSTGSSGTSRGPVATTASASNATSNYYVYADGRTGVATVTVSVNGVVLATKTVTFTGTTAASYYTQTDSTAGNVVDKYIGEGNTSWQDILAKDASGNKLATSVWSNGNGPLGTNTSALYATSSNTAVATVTVSRHRINVLGVASGTATITVCDTSACASPSVSTTFAVTVTKTSLASIKVSTDADSYTPGAAMTFTIAGFDANGNPIANGVDAIGAISGVSFNTTFVNSGDISNIVAGHTYFKNGVVSVSTAFAPQVGPLVISYTDNVAAAAGSVSVTVSNPAADAAQAAIDAAQEATDAANAAYDAANNAMDSADAATAAAQDASDNAAAALAAVTSLSATVAKLVKSVADIAAALAKIQKKLKA